MPPFSKLMDGRKQCACGRSFGPASWGRLPLLGRQANGKDGPGEELELRLCACGSTVAIDLGTLPDSVNRIRI